MLCKIYVRQTESAGPGTKIRGGFDTALSNQECKRAVVLAGKTGQSSCQFFGSLPIRLHPQGKHESQMDIQRYALFEIYHAGCRLVTIRTLSRYPKQTVYDVIKHHGVVQGPQHNVHKSETNRKCKPRILGGSEMNHRCQLGSPGMRARQKVSRSSNWRAARHALGYKSYALKMWHTMMNRMRDKQALHGCRI